VDARRIASLIQSAGARPAAETAALARRLAGEWHPGRGDRTHPVAREWVRRWTPRTMPVTTPGCACAAGRCPVCN